MVQTLFFCIRFLLKMGVKRNHFLCGLHFHSCSNCFLLHLLGLKQWNPNLVAISLNSTNKIQMPQLGKLNCVCIFFVCFRTCRSHLKRQTLIHISATTATAQCGAVSCSVVQCVIVWCSVMQRGAVCCNVFQCGAVCCRLAACCSVLRVAEECYSVLRFVAVSCNVLQCVAACCSVLQCVAVCCSVLQCVAVCYVLVQPVAVSLLWHARPHTHIHTPTHTRTRFVLLTVDHTQ